MNIRIRQGEKGDMPSVYRLIQELADFEKEPDAVELTLENLIEDGFGKTRLFETFVAEIDNSIVGMALFYPRYSTWKGPSIHLEDLIVNQDKRGLKIGSQLYAKVMEYGYKMGVKRIEWAVLDWNTPAIEFYKKTGATILSDWNTVQMSEKAIKKYVESLG